MIGLALSIKRVLSISIIERKLASAAGAAGEAQNPVGTDTFSSTAVINLVPRQSSRRSHAVYVTLQREIVLGVLPPESALIELELADRFGCSQSTVREALMQLNEEGLVKRLPHRGTHAAPCNAADARALLTIRRQVECGYLDRVMARADPGLDAALHQQVNAMRNAARDHDEYLLSVHDRAFHATLFSAADLPLVAPILTRSLIHNHRYKILKSQPNRALEETAERHAPILEAVLSRDVDRLGDLLSHHIRTIVDFGPELTDEPAS